MQSSIVDPHGPVVGRELSFVFSGLGDSGRAEGGGPVGFSNGRWTVVQLPRVFTPPLRDLSEPGATWGTDFAWFCEEKLHDPLSDWQEWLAVHSLEVLTKEKATEFAMIEDDPTAELAKIERLYGPPEVRGGRPIPNGRLRFTKIVILISRQNGKALDVDTPMLTTGGWKTMGTVRPGDFVYHPDGNPVRVTGAFDVMHDHKCYEVETTDGRKVVADADHLWTVQDRRKRSNGELFWETVTTQELVDRGYHRDARGRESAYNLPYQAALRSPVADLPMDPYLMGLWLGDGDSRVPTITVSDLDRDETIQSMVDSGASITSVRADRSCWSVRFNLRENLALHVLREMNVLMNKHVPGTYLAASARQREALLQGLLDSDGSISKQGQVEFSAMNKRLAEDVLLLARSLGWRATLKESRATLRGTDCGAKYRVFFTPSTEDEFKPFRLKRKADRVRSDLKTRGNERKVLSIRSIREVETRPVRCIKVEREDGLFLAGRDLMPTHNTDFVKKLIKWALFRKRLPDVMAAAQNLNKAMGLWREILLELERSPQLAKRLGPVRHLNGSQEIWTEKKRSRYRPVGIDENAGRGDTVDLLYIDELRTQKDYTGVNALEATTTVPDNGLIITTSNAGSDHSVVLRDYRRLAMKPIDDGTWGRTRQGLFEWSAPPEMDIDDESGWKMANPDLGNGRITLATLRAVRESSSEDSFRTERLCQWVDDLERSDFVPLVEPSLWASFGVDVMPDQTERCLGVEVSPDGERFALVSGGLVGDRAHLEVHPQSGEFDVDEALSLIRRYRGSAGQRFVRKGVVEPGDGNSPLAVILDPSTPSILLEPGLRQMGCDPVLLSGPQLSASYQWFMSELRAGKVTHDGSEWWQAAWDVAEKRSGTDGKWPSFDRFSGDVGVLVAGAFAVWGLAEFKPRRPGRDVAVEQKRLIPSGAVRGGAIRGRERVGAF